MSGYERTTVAILGASGFLGRWVAQKLSEQGAQVCPIGREDVSNLESIYRRVRPSVTFNLAGYGVDPSERDEGAAYQINCDLPGMVVETVAAWRDPEWPGPHFVHVGSAAEYGDAGGDLREDGPARPATLYAKSKYRGTRVVAEKSQALGLRAVTARLFTVYGPGERSGRLLPSLSDARRTGRILDLSSGVQQRDFTYVEDVAEGLLKLGLVPGRGGVVNLATGRLTTVRTFVEIAAGILEIPMENLRFGAIPANIHEMEHAPVTLDRLKLWIGWVPATQIAKGVRKSLGNQLALGSGR